MLDEKRNKLANTYFDNKPDSHSVKELQNNPDATILSRMDEIDNVWWKNAAIYQIYPRSFRDTNGDGIGDLQGVINNIDYIKSLNVDAIWLSPFYKTPNRDGGYDVSDPREVDPQFGNNVDAQNLINIAHKNNLKVIFDIVPNHFSSDHIWFQAALNSEPGSSERSRFHFHDGNGSDQNLPPNNWQSLFTGPAWTRVKESNGELGQWYLHLFDSSQPDLNWDNEEVRDDFIKTLKFWFDMGLDGFRVDVAHGLVKDEIRKNHYDPIALTNALRVDQNTVEKSEREKLLSDIPFFDRDGVHNIYREWRKVFDSYPTPKMAVAEAFVYPSSKLTNYVRADELQQVFNFDFLLVNWDLSEIKTIITRTLAELGEVQALPTWVLSNHDSARVVTRIQSDAKARALALITHALPGSVYIYQGEELGLADGEIPLDKRQDPIYFRSGGKDLGRDGGRVPLPWDAELAHFGFTHGVPWLPITDKYEELSISVQEFKTDSFLNLYRHSIRIRKNINSELNSKLTWNESENNILSFNRGENFKAITNFSDAPTTLHLESKQKIILRSDLVVEQLSPLDNYTCVMPAFTTFWLDSSI